MWQRGKPRRGAAGLLSAASRLCSGCRLPWRLSAAGRPRSGGWCRPADGALLPAQLLLHICRHVLRQHRRGTSPRMAPPVGRRVLLLPQRLHGGRRQEASEVQLPADGGWDGGRAWSLSRGVVARAQDKYQDIGGRQSRRRAAQQQRRGPTSRLPTRNALTALARAAVPGGGAPPGARSGGRGCESSGSPRWVPSALASGRGGAGGSGLALGARGGRGHLLSQVRAPPPTPAGLTHRCSAI